MTMFGMIRDINGYNSFLRIQSDEKYNTTLALGVAQTITVPVYFTKCVAIFGYETGSTVWVAVNNTAVLPGVTFASAVTEVNPVGYEVKGGDTISFITPDTNAQVGVVFYSNAQNGAR